jgi:RNA polymerase sigma-70 factor, ECF subfamily
MDDTHAIRLLKQGDLGGLEILMQHHQVRAARTAFLITHDESIAQDVVQETFIRIYERIRQFDDSKPFEPYLMRSVVHAALNAIRGNAKFTSIDDESNDIENLLERAASLEALVETAQLNEEIMQALARLSPRQRAVIIQRYYLEMSEQEMSLALDAAPGTIKWLLNAARHQLHHLLGKKGGANE